VRVTSSARGAVDVLAEHRAHRRERRRRARARRDVRSSPRPRRRRSRRGMAPARRGRAARGRDVEHRQRAMRVDVRVAVSRESASPSPAQPVALHAAHECGDVARDVVRILAEAARVDDRIARVDVDVGTPARGCDRRRCVSAARAVDPSPAPRRAQRRRSRRSPSPDGARTSVSVKRMPDPGLEVGADEQRHVARAILQTRVDETRCARSRSTRTR
jgi:hypothetical protein